MKRYFKKLEKQNKNTFLFIKKGSKMNIFFVGKAGSGKTTLASYLVKNFGYISIKFANPVYMIAEKYFNMKNKDRELLQLIGTEGGRSIDSSIWIRRLLEDITIIERIYKLKGYGKPLFVLDDCRFENEAMMLQQKGWTGVYLSCSDKVRYERLKNRDGYNQESFAEHSSEKEVEMARCYTKYFINTEKDLESIYNDLCFIFSLEKR